jgi:hypothetical protein
MLCLLKMCGDLQIFAAVTHLVECLNLESRDSSVGIETSYVLGSWVIGTRVPQGQHRFPLFHSVRTVSGVLSASLFPKLVGPSLSKAVTEHCCLKVGWRCRVVMYNRKRVGSNTPNRLEACLWRMYRIYCRSCITEVVAVAGGDVIKFKGLWSRLIPKCIRWESPRA